MTALTADRVVEIYTDCLFKDGELSDENMEILKAGGSVEGVTVTEGIIRPTAFHAERLAGHEAEIIEMLHELPEAFMVSGGGGWSFLNACYTKDNEQWTGLHQTMDQLFQLGMGVDAVVCQLPREMWGVLPGGMPYYGITK